MTKLKPLPELTDDLPDEVKIPLGVLRGGKWIFRRVYDSLAPIAPSIARRKIIAQTKSAVCLDWQ